MTPSRATRLLFQLPNNCRVYTAINPAVQWGWQEVLANKANFLLEILVWRGGKDAKNISKAPKLFTPPFMKNTAPINRDTETHTIDEVKDILSRPRK